MIMIFSFWEI